MSSVGSFAWSSRAALAPSAAAYLPAPRSESSGAFQYSAGTDRWDQRVCFGSLLLPKQVNVMDRFVENSEPAYRPKTVGAAYRLDECPSPLMEYGRTILRDRCG